MLFISEGGILGLFRFQNTIQFYNFSLGGGGGGGILCKSKLKMPKSSKTSKFSLEGWGVNTRICQMFPKTAWNQNNLDARSGGGGGGGWTCIPHAPLRSANVFRSEVLKSVADKGILWILNQNFNHSNQLCITDISHILRMWRLIKPQSIPVKIPVT